MKQVTEKLLALSADRVQLTEQLEVIDKQIAACREFLAGYRAGTEDAVKERQATLEDPGDG